MDFESPHAPFTGQKDPAKLGVAFSLQLSSNPLKILGVQYNRSCMNDNAEI